MIEVTEVKEQPTEIDAEHLFAMFKKPMEALQSMLKAEANSIERDGVDASSIELTVKPMMLTVRIGDYILFHEVTHTVKKVGGHNGEETDV